MNMLRAAMLHTDGKAAPFSPCGRRWTAEGRPDEGACKGRKRSGTGTLRLREEDRATPHPALRATFSRRGRREERRPLRGPSFGASRHPSRLETLGVSRAPLDPQGEKGFAHRRRVRIGCVRAFSWKTTGTRMVEIRRTTARARSLRSAMTDAERAMWFLLRSRRFSGFKFRRQVPVGPYVADFLCFERRLVVECDGSQHAENARDARRDAWFAANGFRTLRFWNHDVLNDRDVVADTLFAALSPDAFS
jgi:very-short-patch-repair endonuclease